MTTKKQKLDTVTSKGARFSRIRNMGLGSKLALAFLVLIFAISFLFPAISWAIVIAALSRRILGSWHPKLYQVPIPHQLRQQQPRHL